MRKNSVRKWLHAVLDFLPLLVIPIFAIYTRNENYNSNIEVQVKENKELDFNQWFTNGKSDNNVRGASITYSNYQFTINGTITWDREFYDYTCSDTTFYLIENHKYYYKGNADVNSNITMFIMAGLSNTPQYYTTTSQNIFTCTKTDNYNFRVRLKPSFNYVDTTWYAQITDLTQMYGEGNEPTSVNEYLTQFPNEYYDFTQSNHILVPNQTVIYNDTDVGSQFVYTLYNATDKYFNCTNLFNLEQVWNWVQLNIFGGNAPLMVYVVWQVIVYEFFMDLIFLLYSVFMFVIDFATNCIDRFTGRANRC